MIIFQIKSLAEMTDNPSYTHLTRLFADDNEIESLLDLEGTNFIQNFEQLFMRRNRLKSVSKNIQWPSHLFHSIFIEYTNFLDSTLLVVIFLGSKSGWTNGQSRRESSHL